METWFKRVFLILCLGTSLAGMEKVQAQDLSVIRPDVTPQPVKEALIDSENVEVGIYGGIVHIEDFESSSLWGVRLAYHLSELVFIEGSAGFAQAGETSFEKLAGDVQVLANSERDYRFYSLGLGLNLFPGEVFVGENQAFNTNAYLVAGAGAREFAGDTRFSLTLGFGYSFCLPTAWHCILGSGSMPIGLMYWEKTRRHWIPKPVSASRCFSDSRRLNMVGTRGWLTGLVILMLPLAVSADAGRPVAPDFTLKSRSGENLRLQDFRGQVVMLNFWASWCGPCRQEMPLMDELYAQYRDLGFTVLAVNVDENREEAHRFLDKVPVDYPVLYDPESRVSEMYQVEAMPTTVMVDRDGKARFLHHGYQPGYEDDYEQQIRQLVRE